MSVNKRIKAGRLRLGLTEQQFAAKVGVSRGAVQQWEKEGGTAPTRKNQPAVALLLGLSVQDLMNPGDSDQPKGVARDDLSAVAFELGKLFDLLPDDRVLRTVAYNAATAEILKVLRDSPKKIGNGTD